MHNEPLQKPESRRQSPWNKRKLIGSKPPLRTKDVWSIRTELQVEKRTRDLAMFNLAIDSKLRGCRILRSDGCRVRDTKLEKCGRHSEPRPQEGSGGTLPNGRGSA